MNPSISGLCNSNRSSSKNKRKQETGKIPVILCQGLGWMVLLDLNK